MTADGIAALPYRACVGAVLVNGAGRVFAGQRIDSPGAWQMPQGGIDPGETPRAAVLREVAEETGIAAAALAPLAESADWRHYDLPAALVPRLWGGKFRGQRQKWFAWRHLGEDAEVDIATPDAEFSAFAWMAPAELIDRIVPFKRAVYASVFDEFRAHLAAPDAAVPPAS